MAIPPEAGEQHPDAVGVEKSRQQEGESQPHVSEHTLERDRQLLSAWQRGDTELGLGLVRNYYPYFLSLCWKFGVHSEQDQLDLYQELVLRILKTLPKLTIQSSFPGYLRKVFISAYRDFKKSPAIRFVEEDVSDDLGSPLDRLEQKEMLAGVLDCRGQLREREVRVFNARMFDGIAFSEVAAALGISLGNLYVIYHRACQKMRSCLEQKGLAVV